ncbi:MAG: autotransporter outer membrane beta-barrel domain-containing protein, partial [Alphaproteobacteria bacterium]
MSRRPIVAYAVFATAAFLLMGALGQAAWAALGTCSSNGICTFMGSSDGDTYTVNYNTSASTATFTISGKDTGSGSFTFTSTSTSVTIQGSETIDGVTSQINCTIYSNGTYSGQCGLFPGIFGGTTASGRSSTVQNAVTGSSQAVARSQVQSSISVLLNRIQSISRDIALSSAPPDQQSEQPHRIYSGMSAGSPDKKWGFWADGSGSYLSNNSKIAEFEGYGVTGLAGVDYNLDNRWLFGFSAGYVRTDVSVKAILGERIANGAQFGPYVSYVINQHFTVDGLFNYTRLANGVSGIGNFDSNRYTGAVNVNGFASAGGFGLTGFVGYAYAFENPDTAGVPAVIGGSPTTIHYGAVKIGGEAAYPMGNWEPYVPLTVEYQTTNTRDGTSRTGVTVGAGVRY